MKIKHFAGYGTVNAKVVSRTADEVKILVTGDHEWGLIRDDKYDVAQWLGRKSLGNFEYKDILDMQVEDRDTSATYTVRLRSRC